ncbi:DDE-type integrase/transposase/recombinase [Bdellovibrionota bacterium FG-2]
MDLKLSVLRQEVKRFQKENPRVVVRLLTLIELVKHSQSWGPATEQDRERIAVRQGTTGRTLYRWEAAYRSRGVEALIPNKSSGRPATVIRGHTAKRIREWRKLYNWGAEVIQAHLKHDCDTDISQYKINRYLRKKGLLVRKTCKIKKKHTRVVRVEQPGTHTQTDVKHLPHLLPQAQKCYVYNFVDHASRWSFKKAYDSYGPSETKDFIMAVIAAASFTIYRLQSDNGIEFTNKYVSHADNPKKHALDQLCESSGIRHVLIPPGEKELQGLVERSHRQDDEELFHRIKPLSLEAFNKILSQHCEWRNDKRRRKALGWRTSNEFLADYKQQIENWLYKDGPSPIQIQANQEATDESFVSVKQAA